MDSSMTHYQNQTEGVVWCWLMWSRKKEEMRRLNAQLRKETTDGKRSELAVADAAKKVKP